MICGAILEIKSDAQVSVSGTDIDTCVIDWLDGNPTNITKEEIKSKLSVTQYKRDRESEYPSLNELTVALWEGVVEERMSSVMELEVQRQAVKAKYPKGE